MTLAETLSLLQFVKIKHAMIDTGCKIIEIKCIGLTKNIILHGWRSSHDGTVLVIKACLTKKLTH
ncbi:MAG: hypothetical protein ACI936_001188 [Paraglaciecola sp.]|jgi:hypothetical protein